MITFSKLQHNKKTRRVKFTDLAPRFFREIPECPVFLFLLWHLLILEVRDVLNVVNSRYQTWLFSDNTRQTCKAEFLNPKCISLLSFTERL